MGFYNDNPPISDNKSSDSSFYAVSGDQYINDNYTSLVDYCQKVLADVTAMREQTNGFLVEARIASQDALTILQSVLDQSNAAQEALNDVVGILDEANDTIADYQAIQAAVALSVDENENLQLLINADKDTIAADKVIIQGYKDAAETARTQAQTQANAAGSSASLANDAATDATSQASIATTKATEAFNHSQTADGHRIAAGNSATSAATSLANTQVAATTATNAASSAATSANTASGAATSATNSKTAAEAAAATATTQATSAGGHATSASSSSALANAARSAAAAFAADAEVAYLNTIANAVPLGSTFWFDCNRSAIPDGYAPKDGQLALRADYPDLWIKINRGDFPVITETQWWANADYRGCYTLGTNSTNFRFPDNNGKQAGSRKPFLRGDGYDSAIGKVVGDAIRNISGSAYGLFGQENNSADGAVRSPIASGGLIFTVNASAGHAVRNVSIDASLQVPTANENRPVFTVGVYVVKARGMTDVSFLPQGVSPATLAANIFQGSQEINGELRVTEAARFDELIDVYGKVYAKAGLEVNWGSTLNNGVTINGGLILNDESTVTGRLNHTGLFSHSGDFNQYGTSNLNGTLWVRPSSTGQSASIEIKAKAGGASYIDFIPAGWEEDYTWRTAAYDDGNFVISHRGGGGITLDVAGNLFVKNYGWLHQAFANKNAECQHNHALVEYGGYDAGITNSYAQCPNPFVMIGIRRDQVGPNNISFIRCTTLRNN